MIKRKWLSNKNAKTENVIAAQQAENHNVQKYDFHVLSTQEVRDTGTKDSVFETKAKEVRTRLESENPALATDPLTTKFKDDSPPKSTPQPQQAPQPQQQQAPQPQQAPQENQNVNGVSQELIEMLLGKADELSQSLARMQQQMETQQSEFNARIEEEKQRALQEGYEKGLEETRAQMEQNLGEIKQTMAESIKNIDAAKVKFDVSLEGIEKELSSIAIDIAKEVVISAVSENSASIALELSKSLMQNVKEASTVTLKLNPSDFEFVKTHMEEDSRTTYEADKAIAKGGVVIISDSGNIDGTVMTRYQTLKTTILESRENSD